MKTGGKWREKKGKEKREQILIVVSPHFLLLFAFPP
jgi:hypothetical protein